MDFFWIRFNKCDYSTTVERVIFPRLKVGHMKKRVCLSLYRRSKVKKTSIVNRRKNRSITFEYHQNWPIRCQYPKNWPIRYQYHQNWPIRCQYPKNWPIMYQYHQNWPIRCQYPKNWPIRYQYHQNWPIRYQYHQTDQSGISTTKLTNQVSVP